MYYLRGVDERGRPVDIPVESCWRCLAMVNLTLGTMEDHVERIHPLPEARHALHEGEPPPTP